MQRSLTRVRIAFVGIGVALLCALLLFVRSALARLEHQRKLRHEVVAERIFDELERELTIYLDAESARPSSAYDVVHSEPRSWAPFVVGYFTVDDSYRIVGRDTLDAPRVARVEEALSKLWPSPASPTQTISRSPADTTPPALRPPRRIPQQPSTGSEVLKQLNRAGEERQQPRRKADRNVLEDPFAY